MSMYSN